jgi:hypothetical protein
MREVAGGRTGNDTVVVGGITLRLTQSLIAAFGAPVPIRVLNLRTVVRGRNFLGGQRHHMHGSMPEIDDLLGVTERPLAARARAGVPGVGAGDRVPAGKPFGQSGVTDRTRESAVTDAEESLVPVGGGQPDFEQHVGVGRRFGVSNDAAKCGERRERRCTGPLRVKSTRRHRLGGERGVGDLQAAQGFATHRGVSGR